MDVSGLRHIFAERIKELRAELGLNQGEFADKVGVSRGAMSYYEQEARTPDLNEFRSRRLQRWRTSCFAPTRGFTF